MSLANYIIICDTEIGILAAGLSSEKIVAVSRGATTLVCQIQLVHGDAFTDADAKPISDLQHYMMDNLETMKSLEAKDKVAEMIRLMRALNKKFQ